MQEKESPLQGYTELELFTELWGRAVPVAQKRRIYRQLSQVAMIFANVFHKDKKAILDVLKPTNQNPPTKKVKAMPAEYASPNRLVTTPDRYIVDERQFEEKDCDWCPEKVKKAEVKPKVETPLPAAVLQSMPDVKMVRPTEDVDPIKANN